MPRGGAQKVKMAMPGGLGGRGGMNPSALQAALARQMQQAQAAQVAEQQRTAAAQLAPGQPIPGSSQQPTSAPVHQHQAPRQMQIPSWVNGEDRHRSISIYPIYINKAKSTKGGRRVPKEMAIDRPHLKEMFLVLQNAGFNCLGVPKVHPRDTFKADPSNMGRLYIEFKDSDGNPLKPDIAKNKMELLKYLCKMIPQLKSRVHPSGQMSSAPANSPAVKSAAPAAAAPGPSTPNAAKKTAKAKRKKRR